MHANHYPAFPNFGVSALNSVLHLKSVELKNRNSSLPYIGIITL